MTYPALPSPLPPPLPGEPPSATPPTVPAAPTQATPRPLQRLLVIAGICFVLGIAAVLIGLWSYRLVFQFPSQRTVCLVAMILAGLFATLLFGGTMNCLDRLLDLPTPPRWYARAAIYVTKRCLLVMQLATTAATLAIFGVWVVNRPIPAF